jgi:REP element-mobilizing transposase RayT
MPNHIHLIWRINEKNGKESSYGSFLKFTAHEFRRKLLESDRRFLSKFKVTAINKEYEFWQRDPLAVHLYSENVAYQKLEYIHNNPLAEHWNLAKDPIDYEFSSAAFYEGKENRFSFLKDLRGEF